MRFRSDISVWAEWVQPTIPHFGAELIPLRTPIARIESQHSDTLIDFAVAIARFRPNGAAVGGGGGWWWVVMVGGGWWWLMVDGDDDEDG